MQGARLLECQMRSERVAAISLSNCSCQRTGCLETYAAWTEGADRLSVLFFGAHRQTGTETQLTRLTHTPPDMISIEPGHFHVLLLNAYVSLRQ